MQAGPKTEPGTPRPHLLVVWLLLLVLPALAVGPALMPGERLLSQLPVAFPPLALEYPTAADAARDGMNYSTSDRLFPVLTDQVEARRQLAAGTLPTWDPHLGAGVPLFAGSIAGLAYPPNWLGLLLAPDLAAAWLALLSLFLAGLGMWLFLRAKGCTFEAALAGALFMQASLWGFTNLHDFMKVDAALWTPWLLLGVERIRQARRGGLLLLALAGGLSLLAGFYPIAIFGLATAGLYAAGTLLPQPRRFGRALAGFLLALGIGAWQVLPALEASEHSLRQSGGAAAMEGQALPPAASAGLLVPDLFGTPDEISAAAIDPMAAALVSRARQDALPRVNALEWNLHFGVLALLFGLVALITRPRQAAAPAALLLLWFGFAQAWPGFAWLYHLPGLDAGAPGRALAMAWPLFAWLGALGVEALARESERLRLWRDPHRQPTSRQRREGLSVADVRTEREPLFVTLVAASLGVLAMAGALAAWAWLDPTQDPGALQRAIAERHGLPLSEVAALVPGGALTAALLRVHAALGAWFASGLLIASAAVLVRLVSGRALLGRGTLAMALALAIALAPRLASGAFELPLSETALLALGAGLVGLLFLHGSTPFTRNVPEWEHPGWQHNALAVLLVVGLGAEALDVAPRHLTPRTVEPAELAATSERSRAVQVFPPSEAMDAIAATTGGTGRVLRVDASAEGVAEVVQLARPNMLSAYGLRDLTPYIVFTPRTLIELVTQAGAGRSFRSGITAPADFAGTDSSTLDLLRVTTVLSVRPLDDPRLEPVWEAPGFHVYRRPGALDVARLVPTAVLPDSDAEALARLAAPDFAPRKEVVLAPGTLLPDGARLTAEADPDATVITRRPAANRLDVQVTSRDGGWLLMTEQFMPDWKVNLDGVDAELVRANHALRALWVPPGEHLVRTWYEPWSLRYGAALALLSALLAGLLTWRERPPRTPEPTPAT